MDGRRGELKTPEEALIGNWQGEAYDEDSFYKKWLHIKYANGNYLTAFERFSTKGGEPEETWVAYGKWWVEDDLLYQYESDWMSDPIVYKYEFNKRGCINYQLVTGDEEDDVVDDYKFTACPQIR
ncbi:MAG: hypothetical protein ACJA04_000380 [Cellvibrionaceae bacterium]|jgi:hypothetical protein